MGFITRRKRDASELDLPDGKPIYKKKLGSGELTEVTAPVPEKRTSEANTQVSATIPKKRENEEPAKSPTPFIKHESKASVVTADEKKPTSNDADKVVTPRASSSPPRPIASIVTADEKKPTSDDPDAVATPRASSSPPRPIAYNKWIATELTADEEKPIRDDAEEVKTPRAVSPPEAPIAGNKRSAAESGLTTGGSVIKKKRENESVSKVAPGSKPLITEKHFFPPGGPPKFVKKRPKGMPSLQVPGFSNTRSIERHPCPGKTINQDYVDFRFEQEKQRQEREGVEEDSLATLGADLQTPDYFFEGAYSPSSPWTPTPTKPTEVPEITVTPPSPYLVPSQNPNHYDYDVRAPHDRFFWINFRTKTIFSFPNNVREKIYSYALFPKGIEGHEPSPMFSPNSTWRVKVPALLQTAFDVRKEALPFYYKQMKVGCRAPMHAKMWLSSIGVEARKALGAMIVAWDGSERTDKEQMERAWTKFRAAGVQVPKEIIDLP